MKTYLASLLRHATTALLGLGGLLLSHDLIDPSDVAAVDTAGVSLQGAVVVIGVAVVGRLAITLTGKIFPGLSESATAVPGREKSRTGAGGLPLLVGLCMAAGLMGLGLPSCSGDYPLTGSILYRDPTTGAKGGLVFAPGKAPAAVLKVQLYDPRTGQPLGVVDLRGGK